MRKQLYLKFSRPRIHLVKSFAKTAALLTPVMVIILLLKLGMNSLYNDRICGNVTFLGVDLGKLTREQGLVRIKEIADLALQRNIIFILDGQKYWYNEFVAAFDPAGMMNEAYSVGHTGGFFPRLVDRICLLLSPYRVQFPFRYNQAALYRYLAELTRSSRPKNAWLNLANKRIIREREGTEYDLGLAIRNLESQFHNTSFSGAGTIEIVLNGKMKSPDYTFEDVKKVTGLTKLEVWYNIIIPDSSEKIAEYIIENLDGYLVYPGEERCFSSLSLPDQIQVQGESNPDFQIDFNQGKIKNNGREPILIECQWKPNNRSVMIKLFGKSGDMN